MRRQGEVYYIPAGSGEAGDPKERRHVLISECEEGECATFAYASTRNVEAEFGAVFHLVDPAANRYNRMCFDRPTYIFPGRLIRTESEDLDEPVGKLVDDMSLVRGKLRTALGLETGTMHAGRAAGSLRGVIAELEESDQTDIDTTHVLIVTEPTYSREQRFQVVVPIYDGEDFEPTGEDIELRNTQWRGSSGLDLKGAFLAMSETQSFFQPKHFRRFFDLCTDEATMNRVDEAFIRLFLV